MAHDPGLLLIFTIDTECSVLRQPNPDPQSVVDELIFGDFSDGRRPAGIGLHMDLLEQFGFRGCFFIDVLMEFEHGQEALERTVEAIVMRGHEVELHVHPEHLLWSSDSRVERLAEDLSGGRAAMDPDVFRRLMELSVDLFRRRVGRAPIAYRAGGYRIADIQFPVLGEFGIRIDSSVQPYFNSQVDDWMRTRTQPYRVGDVLEVPPSYLVLNEKPDEWETRGLTPNSNLGDPISAFPAEPDDAPAVLTFVSHSFQLLHRYDSDDAEAIAEFERRLRAAVSPEMAGRLSSDLTGPVRTFGKDVDDGLVAAVARILGRVASRPDATCATYAELAAFADRFWPSEAHPPIDPVPTVDRNEGVACITGTRVYGPSLLTHLAGRGQTPIARKAEEAWTPDRCRRLAGGRWVRFRTLGVAPPAYRGALPPLAEVLFPAAAIESVADQLGTRLWRGLPWDGQTFKEWLRERGFEVVAERAVPRSAAELAALEPFAEKLAWLDRRALETQALELELRPGTLVPAPHGNRARIDPMTLPTAATALYKSLRPGERTTLRISEDTRPATRTTRLLALLRAGLEIVGREGDEYALTRPLDLADICQFAGIAR